MTGKVFGVSLDKLVESDRKKHPELNIPWIAQQCINCIIRDGFDSEGIFRLSGNKEKINSIKDALDKGEEVDFLKEKSNANDICSIFKMFLRELPDPVLTYERYDKWLEVHDLRDAEEQKLKIKELLDSLPIPNRSLLASVIPLLARIAMNSPINKMDSGNLSKTVGPNLLWKEGKGDSVEYLVHSGKVNHIVQLMIDDYLYYFPIAESSGKYASFYGKLFGHKKSVQCLLKNGPSHPNEIWSCDSNGSIRIWDNSTMTCVKEIETDQGRVFTMSKIGDTIWTSSQRSAKIWDSKTKECIKKLDAFVYSMIQVGSTIWVGSEDKIIVYNDQYSSIKEFPVPGIVIALSIDSSSKFVWTGGIDKCIRVFNTETYECVKTIKDGHQRRINVMTLVGDKIWSAGDDNSLFIWDTTDYKLVKQIDDAHSGAIYGLTAYGDFVMSCSWDTSIHIWNSQSFEKVYALPKYHSDAVTSAIIVMNDDKKIWQAWTSSWDKSICVWNLGNKLAPVTSESTSSKKEGSEGKSKESKKSRSRSNSKGAGGKSDKTNEEKLEELTRKSNTLKEKQKELSQKSQELKQRKEDLENRKEKMSKKKQELEDRKKELFKRKEELSALQSELEANPSSN